jgi:hypothetical protein
MIATAVLAADVATTLDLSDHTEVRARATPPIGTAGASAPGTATVGIDVMTRPEAHLYAKDRRWEYNLGYQVSLIAPDLETSFAPLALQLGSAAVSWHDRLVRVSVAQDGTYGIQNSAYLLPTVQAAPAPAPGATPTTPGQPPTPVQTAPQPGTLTYGYSRTQLKTALTLDRRTQALAGLEYLLSGGLDDPSRQLLPLQRGPRATAEIDRLLSRRDSLVTSGSAQQADFSPAPCPPGVDTGTCELSDRVYQIVETYRRALSRSSSAALGAGLAAAAWRLHSYVHYGTTYFPVAEASYNESFGSRGVSTLSLYGRLAPFIDLRTGLVLEAVQGDASLSDRLSRHVTLRLSAGASQSVPTNNPAAATVLRGEVGVDYHVDPAHEGSGVSGAGPIDLSMGERWLWQEQNGFPGFVSAFGYLAVTVREPTLHL